MPPRRRSPLLGLPQGWSQRSMTQTGHSGPVLTTHAPSIHRTVLELLNLLKIRGSTMANGLLKPRPRVCVYFSLNARSKYKRHFPPSPPPSPPPLSPEVAATMSPSSPSPSVSASVLIIGTRPKVTASSSSRAGSSALHPHCALSSTFTKTGSHRAGMRAANPTPVKFVPGARQSSGRSSSKRRARRARQATANGIKYVWASRWRSLRQGEGMGPMGPHWHQWDAMGPSGVSWGS